MSKTSLTALILCFALFVCYGHVEAQVPAGKWWHMPGVVNKLQITDADSKQLDDLFIQSRLRLFDLKSDLEKEQFKLQNFMQRDPLDEKGALEQFAKVQAARARLDAERFTFLLSVRKILGQERFQHLEMIVNEFRQNPGRNLRQRLNSLQGSGIDQENE